MKGTFVLLAVAGFFGFQPYDRNAKPIPPIVVAHRNFLNESAPIPNTSLFTPTADGDFRLSVYVEAQGSSLSGEVCAFFSWTDDFAQHPQAGSVTAFLGGAATFGNGVMIARAKADTPITMEVSRTVSGCNIPPDYSVFVTVEELPKTKTENESSY